MRLPLRHSNTVLEVGLEPTIDWYFRATISRRPLVLLTNVVYVLMGSKQIIRAVQMSTPLLLSLFIVLHSCTFGATSGRYP